MFLILHKELSLTPQTAGDKENVYQYKKCFSESLPTAVINIP